MSAIIPLNIKALRVSATDASNVVAGFKGRAAAFDRMPYRGGPSGSSTGDAVVQPLESADSPLATLAQGIHLHWELPDCFRKGVQEQPDGRIVFPQAPNRWLVIRYLNRYDDKSGRWLEPSVHSWVVESDYVSQEEQRDDDGAVRSCVPVPLPADPAFGERPYRYMGRVVDAARWPLSGPEDKYLSDYTDGDGNPCRLTAVGFLGPAFSSYYPDCCSVFGFHDRFSDDAVICDAVRSGLPLRFKASYQVIGWIDGSDPLSDVRSAADKAYDRYLRGRSGFEDTPPVSRAAFSVRYAEKRFGWTFRDTGNDTDDAVPERTLCGGVLQEIVWDTAEAPSATGFLGNPSEPSSPAVWESSDACVSVGNSSPESLSALLKGDANGEAAESYELMLNLIQSGLLRDAENRGDLVRAIAPELFEKEFGRHSGGYVWVVQQKEQEGEPAVPGREVSLPTALAERLSVLNTAQKEYDTARAALTEIRTQLFMDWYRYVKMYCGNEGGSVDLNALIRFIGTAGSGELGYVVDEGNRTGLLAYSTGADGKSINGINEPAGGAESLAYDVWKKYDDLRARLAEYPGWEMLCVPASCFWTAPDAVLTLESAVLDCRDRNGGGSVAVRRNGELITSLSLESGSFGGEIPASGLNLHPLIPGSVPAREDIVTLAEEGMLLMPATSMSAAAYFANRYRDNPAANDPYALALALASAQGGISQLDGGGEEGGLFGLVRNEAYEPAPDPVVKAESLPSLNVRFTRPGGGALPPSRVCWETQERIPYMGDKRFDPFLPLQLVWTAEMEHLLKTGAENGYGPDNITRFFSFGETGRNLTYDPARPFHSKDRIAYGGSAPIIKKTGRSLTARLDEFTENNAGDPDAAHTAKKSAAYANRRIVSETMSGTGVNQILRTYLPNIGVANLAAGKKDAVTAQVADAALNSAPGDSWYDDGFNTQAPVSGGSAALGGFGPLRSGFLSVKRLEAIDVFGQRMRLGTPSMNPDGSLSVSTAAALSPLPEDAEHAGKAYLPPRLMSPARLFFRWLGAETSGTVKETENGYVEMGLHPAASPVCGWIMPDNLNRRLVFYDRDGSETGSFGLEHGQQKYRTRPGNASNPGDSLAEDIGAPGRPSVNAHLADFMWYIDRVGAKHGAGFMSDLLTAISRSDRFVSSRNSPRDGSLAVLTGRPLALARAVLRLETAGMLLPLDQTDTNDGDAWPRDVANGRYRYPDRMKHGSAALGGVEIPVRLGNVYDTDDGLVGYITENADGDPYAENTLYAPAAEPGSAHGVAKPEDFGIRLTLEGGSISFTFLLDPRGAVHASCGILPAERIGIPPDQYAEAANGLGISFPLFPALKQKYSYSIPFPSQSGYEWKWSAAESREPVTLDDRNVTGKTAWGYSPQKLEEGWLQFRKTEDNE